MDWGEKYKELAELIGMENYELKVLPKETMLKNCNHFVECIIRGHRYEAKVITEEEANVLRKRIKELEEEINKLKRNEFVALPNMEI